MTAERTEFGSYRQKLRSSVRDGLKRDARKATLRTSPIHFRQSLAWSLREFNGDKTAEDFQRQLISGANMIQGHVNILGGNEFPDLLRRALRTTLDDLQRSYNPQLLRTDSEQALRARTTLLGARLFVSFIASVQPRVAQ